MEVDIPFSVDPMLLNEDLCEAKQKIKLSKHFCGDDETVEAILRKIISVNQLSVYEAVADICDELAWRISGCSESTGKNCCSEQVGDSGDANRIVDNAQRTSDQ